MSAPKEIVELVDKFSRRINEYRCSLYNETELRNEFVNPFFAALGWDMDNRQGLPGDLKEVKVEESIRVEESIKNPDYSFRLGRNRKFFVETKKPSINIEGGVYPAFQLRRYAWSARLSLSILTDFEELAVYDCRAEPNKADKPGKGRLLYLQYDQYVERWDEIAALFSKEAVLAGSLERFLEAIPEKRGIKRVDAALLDEISSWREALAGNLARRNPQLSQSDLNFSVQRTIDRLLFLRICEDRAIEEYGRLKALLQVEGVYARLMELFREADRRYNSGIFHFQEERDRSEMPDSLTAALVVDDATLKDIIQDLYYPDSPYVFSEIPAEILGQVYEQFLGKVIRLEEGHRAVVEDKPEVRKAGGVYYTPSYIVDYIVKNTVGRLLEGRTAAEAAEIRILDPACGSGSFLIGAYQYLLDWHLDWYKANLAPLLDKSGGMASVEALRLLPAPPEGRSDRRARRIAARAAQAALPITKDNISREWRLTTSERKRILQSSIYGVDIDSQAVEVTKLSLLLKVLEGESRESISSLLRYFKERALPDLGENIRCGNSLIGYDYYDDHPKISDEEANRVNAFDWKTGFAEVFERGGFDAVIGNPPYLRIQGLQENFSKQINYYVSHFKSATKRFDMYLLFIENGFNLLAKNGILGFICPHKFLNSDFGSGIREFIASNFALSSIISFGENRIFDQASTYTGILILQRIREKSFKYYEFSTVNQLELSRKLMMLKNNDFAVYDKDSLSSKPWMLTNSPVNMVLKKIKKMPEKLLDVFEGVFRGIVTGADEIYLLRKVDDKDEDMIEVSSEIKNKIIKIEKNMIKPSLKGEDVKRYTNPTYNYYCIYPYELNKNKTIILEEEKLSARYPLAYKYLFEFHDKLKAIREKFKTNPSYWYSCHRGRSMTVFERDRIIAPYMSLGCSMTICPAGIYHNDKVFSLIPKSSQKEKLHYWLGILNSNLMWWFISNTGYVLRGGYFAFTTEYLSPFPIRTINFSDPADVARHDRMVELVQTMLDLHRQLSSPGPEHERTLIARRIEAKDRQIDRLVYELYGLTEEEIEIVETASR